MRALTSLGFCFLSGSWMACGFEPANPQGSMAMGHGLAQSALTSAASAPASEASLDEGEGLTADLDCGGSIYPVVEPTSPTSRTLYAGRTYTVAWRSKLCDPAADKVDKFVVRMSCTGREPYDVHIFTDHTGKVNSTTWIPPCMTCPSAQIRIKVVDTKGHDGYGGIGPYSLEKTADCGPFPLPEPCAGPRCPRPDLASRQ